jgi:hypothetical protein
MTLLVLYPEEGDPSPVSVENPDISLHVEISHDCSCSYR